MKRYAVVIYEGAPLQTLVVAFLHDRELAIDHYRVLQFAIPLPMIALLKCIQRTTISKVIRKRSGLIMHYEIGHMQRNLSVNYEVFTTTSIYYFLTFNTKNNRLKYITMDSSPSLKKKSANDYVNSSEIRQSWHTHLRNFDVN